MMPSKQSKSAIVQVYSVCCISSTYFVSAKCFRLPKLPVAADVAAPVWSVDTEEGIDEDTILGRVAGATSPAYETCVCEGSDAVTSITSPIARAVESIYAASLDKTELEAGAWVEEEGLLNGRGVRSGG